MPACLLAVACAVFCLAAPQAFRWAGDAFPVPGAKGAIQLRDGSILTTRTEGRDGGVAVVCSRSEDGGRTWKAWGVIVTDAEPRADIGDGCLLERRQGELLYSYRDNRPASAGEGPSYAIRVRSSADGRTWRPHSTVDTARGEGRGLWSSFLLERRDGEVQCYYDDERTPWGCGFPRHQWVTMRTWDHRQRAWTTPVTVSRAYNPAHLSRDGMPSVVELSPGRLLCVLESVQVTPPHAGVVFQVTSEDGGRTWSWARAERAVVYEPADKRFAAYAPWLARLRSGELVCVFGTNEERPEPSRPGSPPHELNLDIKYVGSDDGGKTWSRPPVTVYEGSHQAYMPGVVALRKGPLTGGLLFLLLDCRSGFRARIAEPVKAGQRVR